MTDDRSTFPAGTILGYPRLGARRELKRAVEAHWAGEIDEAELEAIGARLRRDTRERLHALGLGRTDSSIPETFSFYDQVLDAAIAVGALPDRFAGSFRDPSGLAAAFTAARGSGDLPPLEMTKWFDTNYHYLVPEIGPETAFTLHGDRFVRQVAEARADGFTVRPVIVGPVTLLALAKATVDAPAQFRPLDRLDDLLPVYAQLLADLRAAGAEWVQLDEPALVSESLGATTTELADAAARAYALLGAATARPAILVAAPYAQLSAEAWRTLAIAPVEALAIDLTRGAVPDAAPGLDRKTLVGGVIDGRNIWRGDLAGAWTILESLAGLGAAAVAVGTSASLQHVPYDVTTETRLDPRLISWLAFADQKVAQVVTLARGRVHGAATIAAEVAAASAALEDRRTAPGVRDGVVRSRAARLTEADYARGDYESRLDAQSTLGLPLLPTTTIGSFPQTGDIRRARAQHAKGLLSTEDYEDFLRVEITSVIGLQEELELDVLVHGEAERNDMVQYFAENLNGFAVTEHGWVQSYGSRATRPSILWGDVSRPEPITVGWSRFAQSLTDRPVKGMLTGPVTILAWSFVRDDQPLGDTARQVALALREEIADLEHAGIRIIQVDEPALRELLPLKKHDQPGYLDWSVRSFRLATAGAADQTQVHTHLCYSEFDAVIDAIAALDADVTSIEAARSRGEVIGDIARSGFAHGIGPGVYDIHSPRVPTVDEIVGLLERATGELPLRQLWINPDCGLKTRGYAETVAALHNLVVATHTVGERIGVPVWVRFSRAGPSPRRVWARGPSPQATRESSRRWGRRHRGAAAARAPTPPRPKPRARGRCHRPTAVAARTARSRRARR
jgi:5-methyltetrahydropteroyltriglutamate--homocysteine methyltransferase